MIYTFYSYKGGVGRSMALANIAKLFYRQGQKVLIVDWDLEAPGIERYFFETLGSVIGHPGLMDMLLSYKEKMSKELDEDAPLEFEPIDRFIIDVYKNASSKGKLQLLTAGQRLGDQLSRYAQEVLNFDWHDFYENWEGELYFEWLRKQFENIADIILIDSRTGVTEMSGVCTYQLADTVIMFCATNQQNIEGTYEMALNFTSPDIQRLRPDRPLNVLIVPARVEDRAEVDHLNRYRKLFKKKFDKILSERPIAGLDSYWDLKIPYLAYCSFDESLVVDEKTQSYSEDISRAFQFLAEKMAKIDGRAFDFYRLFKPKLIRPATTSYDIGKEKSQTFSYSHWAWEDENWDTLIYTINQNNCILMLGPDTAVETVDGEQRLLTKILANHLAEKIEPGILERINPSDLAQVSQYYAMEKGRHFLEAQVASFYKYNKTLCSHLHLNLASLPFYFTITTTPDSMFINALEENNKEPVMNWYNFNGENPGMVQMGTVEKPLLFYLYGGVPEPASLMLTETDLLDFLVALCSGKRPLPDNIRSELQDENKSFLFLGFGFRNWYLRILLHVLQGGYKKNSRSFAFEKFQPENTAELQRTVFFFEKSNYKIHIFQQDLDNFVEELRERFERSTPSYVSKIHLKDAPRVFICHTPEDKDYAASLYKELENAGFIPWFDKENIRGGDEWNRLINRMIKREIDYFIVLQSKALAKKREGYVIREINIALERTKEFRPGIRFIIPVKIEKCNLLEYLEHLNTFDLTDKADIKKLINTIQRDFEKRKITNK
jgi:MinD-like ATPase involved in chromosome partitioning or flagellar assembly